MAQSQASDSWAYYQAKSIKETMYRMKIEDLETDPPDNVDQMKLEILRQKYQQTADRYDAEQLEIRNS